VICLRYSYSRILHLPTQVEGASSYKKTKTESHQKAVAVCQEESGSYRKAGKGFRISKAKQKSVEFGAKLSVSCVNGYLFLDRFNWNNFNESCDLELQIEIFKNRTGLYSELVHVDKIYRNRKNRAFCKEKGIRISGASLRMPKKNVSKEEKKQVQNDERVRNCIEGKFGEGKRRYSLNLVMAKLPNSSEAVIAITFLTMNLSALLRQILLLFLQEEHRSYFLLLDISKNHTKCQLVN
jgi:transposase, IS5 family